MPHLNSKQNKIQIQSTAYRITTSLSLAHQKKNKQTDKQKFSTNLTLYEAHTNHWANLRKAEIKRKKGFNLHQRKNKQKLSTNLTNLAQITGPALEGKKPKQKEFNPEAWEKETSDTIS